MPPRIYVVKAKRGYCWRIVRGGRITANGEVFATRANAIRAVRNVVRSLCGIFDVPVEVKVKRRADGAVEVVPILGGFFWPAKSGERPNG